MVPVARAIVFTAAAFVASHALAHHSPALFDLTKDVAVEGTVTAFEWRNPHVYLALEVTDPNGQKREQRIEAGPASNLMTAGMNAGSFRVGEHVVVQAKANRANATGTVLGWVVTKQDGSTLPLHVRAMSAAAVGSATAASLAGTWVPVASGFTTLAQAARMWPLTDAGKAAVANGHDAQTAVRTACIPFGPPALMTLPSATVVTIDAKTVTFELDAMSTRRIVHLDETSHPASLQPSVHGHSIGHWEGSTLVVDTAAYAPHAEGMSFDLPSSGKKHVIERFTLSADGKRLEYDVLVEDPEYYTTPIRHRSDWNYRPDQQPSGLPCDPDSARRFISE